MVVWIGLSSGRFSFFLVLLGVSLSVLGLTVSSHFLFIWMCLVLGTLCTTGWLSLMLPALPLSLYFVSSALGGLLFVVSSYSSSLPHLFVFLALLLLLGFFPFQFWSLSVLANLPLSSTCVFQGPMKLGYLFLLLESPLSLLWVGLISFVTGLILIFTSIKIWALLWASSSTLLLQVLLLDSVLGFLYYIVYSSTMLCLSHYVDTNFSLLIFFCSLAGMPPLGMFWPKLLALYSIPFFHCMILLICSALTLYPYFFFGLANPSHSLPSFSSTLLLNVMMPLSICLPVLFPFCV